MNFLFWAIISLYLLSLLFFAKFTYKRDRSDEEYFFAKHKLPTFFSFVSLVATESSVASLLIFPQIGFQGNLSLLFLALGFIAGRFIVSRLYLPRLYKSSSLSIYAEMSQDAIAHKWLSFSYLLAKYISGGVRFFLGAYALSVLLGSEIYFWILFLSILCGVYSLTGGLRAVVWTDQLQGALIFFVGIFILFSLGSHLSFSTIIQKTSFSQFINFDFSLANPSFTPILFIGGLILSIGSHGTDQDLLQRVLASSSLSKSQKAMFASGFGAFLVICIYLFIGYFLSLTEIQNISSKYPLLAYAKTFPQTIFLAFFTILLLAAGMSTIDSSLNSTGAIWKSIFSLKKTKTIFSKNSSIVYSLLSLTILVFSAQIFSYLSKYTSDFLSLALGSMNYINGGLIAIFSFAIFQKIKLDKVSISLALLSGFFTTTFCQIFFKEKIAWPYITIFSTSIPFFLLFLIKYCSMKNKKYKKS